MKKELLVCMTVFMFLAFFAQNSFCEVFSDSEAEILVNQERTQSINGALPEPKDIKQSFNAIQSKLGFRGRSASSFSNNPDELAPLLGTKWHFSYKIGSTIYTDELTFKNTTVQLSSSVIVDCSNQYGSTGIGASGDMNELIGGKGFAVTISGSSLDDFYFFRISGETATGLYSFKSKISGISSSSYVLTGTRVSGPSPATTDNNNDDSIDISNCKIMPKSMSISNTSIPTTNDYVNFTVNAISDCSTTLYYYYSYAPDYGTDDYGKNDWVKMVSDGNGFSSSNTVSCKFPNPGYYVVVAWISPKMAPSDPINMIGCTVIVK